MTRLSIIVPVYNSEKYIAKCLDSIFGVRCDDVEVIVIDDGSMDKSGQICDNYAKKFKNIHVFHEANKGVSCARNLGIKHACGDYIMFLDSDDTLTENWCDVLSEISDKDLYFIDERLANGEKELLKYVLGRNEKGIILSAPTSKIINLKFIKDAGISFKEDVIHGEDMLFLIELLCKTDNVDSISEKIYNYNVRSGSLSHIFDERLFASDQIFHKYVADLNIDKDDKIYLIQNSIFVLSQKISLIKPYKKARMYFEKLNDEVYRKSLKENLIVKDKYKPFIKMFKAGKYRLLYNTLRIMRKIRREG